MYQISLLISGLLANMFHTPKVVIKTTIEVQEKLDPRGLVHTDMKYIERHYRPVHYKAGMNLPDVAYQQGQADMITFIKTKVIGRRLDG